MSATSPTISIRRFFSSHDDEEEEHYQIGDIVDSEFIEEAQPIESSPLNRFAPMVYGGGSIQFMTRLAPGSGIYGHFSGIMHRLQDVEIKVGNLFRLVGAPGIEKTPGVCGGAACIVRTRIPVWILEALKRQGATDAQILTDYPTINATDLVAARAYVEANRAEIDEKIVENDAV